MSLPDEAKCLDCDYALRGLLSNVCPECGRGFDPAVRSTYKSRHWYHMWHLWESPQPMRTIVVAFVLTVMLLSLASCPGQFSLGAALAITTCGFFFSTAMLDYLVRTLVYATRGRYITRHGQPYRGAGRWRWYAIPVLILIASSSVLTDWPVRLRFWMSRSALESAARMHVATGTSMTQPQWIGVYRIEEIVTSADGVFFVTGSWFGDQEGFMYRPDDPEPATPNRLAPKWYCDQH